ncbi:unnamed protein product, partial [Didymodactylos carnosus]
IPEIDDYDLAAEYLEKTSAIFIKNYGENDPVVAATHNLGILNLGILYSCKNDYEMARCDEEKSLEIRELLLPKDHPDLAE